MAAQPEEALADFIGQALEHLPDWAEALVFVDQFEELFTVVDKRHHEPFIRLLCAAAGASRMRMVLTVRADFYDRSLAFPELAELLRTGSFPLPPPASARCTR